MIYITRDERDPNNFIEYHCVFKRRKIFKSNTKKVEGFFVKLKLYDPIIDKYKNQIVFIKQDKIEFSDKNDIYKITKWEG